MQDIKESRIHLTADKTGLERRLLIPENAELLKESITGLLNVIREEIKEDANQLAEATGMCKRVATIRITTSLITALEEELAIDCARALYRGDSKQTVSKATGRDASNLMRANTTLGKNIQTVLDAYVDLSDKDPKEAAGKAVDLGDRVILLNHPTIEDQAEENANSSLPSLDMYVDRKYLSDSGASSAVA